LGIFRDRSSFERAIDDVDFALSMTNHHQSFRHREGWKTGRWIFVGVRRWGLVAHGMSIGFA
jgi:hypothetical protein